MGIDDPASPRKKSAELPMRILIAMVIGLFALLPLYVGAYFVTGSRTVGGPTEFQGYQYEWQANLFEPAVKIESALRQQPIDVGWRTYPNDPTR